MVLLAPLVKPICLMCITIAVETTAPEVSAPPSNVVENHENGTATETHEADEKPAATEGMPPHSRFEFASPDFVNCI